MRKSGIVLLALLSSAVALRAGTNVWTSHGPGGGSINALVIDPKNPNTLYVSAGTGGVFKSTDGGTSWIAASSGLTGSSYGLTIDSDNPSTLYTWSGRLFKSTDGAQSWNELSLPSGISSVVLGPRDPATIYAAAGFTGVLKSTDGGASWNAVSAGLQGLGVATLAVSPQNPATLYAGVFPRGTAGIGPVFRSTDGGATWISPLKQKLLDLGLPPGNSCDTWNYYFARIVGRDAPPADQLSCYPPDNREVEITVDEYLTALQAFANRRPDAADFGLIANVRMLLADPQNSSKAYALAGRGIFASVDGGLSWNDASPTKFALNSLAMDIANPGTLYAGGWNGQLYKSVDGGFSWDLFIVPVNSGINVVAVDPQDSSTIYAGTGLGLFKTTDAASSWALRESGLADANVFSMIVDQQTPGTVYATVAGGSMFKTTDAGSTWMHLDFVPTIGGFAVVVAVDPRNPATVYAAGVYGNPPLTTLFKSTDAGASWSITGLRQFSGRLVVDPRNSDTLYALSGLVGGGIIKSTDGGNTWASVNSGLGGTPNNVLSIAALIIDPQSPDTLYTVRSSDGQMFRTTDGAASWNAIKTGWDPRLFHLAALVADPQNSGTLYAGTSEFDCGYGDTCPADYYEKVTAAGGTGVFKTTDGGQSWVKLDFPSTTSGYLGFYSFAIDPRNSTTLYAAAGYPSRVYRSTDSGASWKGLNSALTTAYVSALAVDGQDPSTLYAATQGSGVLAITFAPQ